MKWEYADKYNSGSNPDPVFSSSEPSEQNNNAESNVYRINRVQIEANVLPVENKLRKKDCDQDEKIVIDFFMLFCKEVPKAKYTEPDEDSKIIIQIKEEINKDN